MNLLPEGFNNYRISIGAGKATFEAKFLNTEKEMKKFVWEAINTGWLRQDDNEYFFLPAHRIDYITVEKI